MGLTMIPGNDFVSDFEVCVYYRGRRVLQTVVPHSQGFRLVAPDSPGSPSPSPGLPDIPLPDVGCLSDQLQATYTTKLLQRLAPGVIIRAEQSALWGGRWGRCHAYWSHSEIPSVGAPGGELPKEEFAPLLRVQQYTQDLIGYIKGARGSPDYTLWLCFGEDWPDYQRPWKKKLIMVQVIPKVLETLYEMSQHGGSSSLQGAEPDLRISDSLQGKSLLEFLEDWEQEMDAENYG
uniref:Interferon regulatory factor-3 domain-containing protein n=1 Tax=Sphenodon punctatus TaxID=8508 RepID=A0A8D0L6Z7_SPHPU